MARPERQVGKIQACQRRHERKLIVSDSQPHDADSIRQRNDRHDQKRFIEAPSAALTALLDMLAATLPPFAADAEIAGAIIDKIGVGKIVRPDHPRARARPLELGLRARRRQR